MPGSYVILKKPKGVKVPLVWEKQEASTLVGDSGVHILNMRDLTEGG